MRRMLFLAGFAVLLTGCQSFVAQGYVSPRVTGRVLDAATLAPLAQVSIRRMNNGEERGSYSNLPQHGGELIMARDIVRTRSDGRFTLAAEEIALGVVSPMTVRLELQCARYHTLVTNFPASLVTSPAPKGPPVLNAGDILMQRAAP